MNWQIRLALLLVSAWSMIWPMQSHSAEPPNILFLFADDMTYEALGSLEHTDIDTPNLDRLAQRGTQFTHAYNMGSWSGAVCVASRTMLITGRTLWDAHSVYDTTNAEREAGRLWPQLLAARGYDTYFTGKWHIQTQAERTFHTARHVRGGMPRDTPEGYNRPIEGQPDRWSPSDPQFGGFWEGGRHWSEVVADDAEEFLSLAKSRHQPFFMYLAFNAPHDPRQAPREFVERYPLSRIAVPDNFLPEYPHHVAMGCPPGLRDEKLSPFPRTPYAVQVHRQEYYASITHLDEQLGRILAALEHTGKGGNTWIFFTADHGLAVGHHGLFGKQNMYEHSLRVPFLVVGPGVEAGAKRADRIYLQDVMPTTLELAGIELPEQVGFHSLLPLLRGIASPASRKSIYGAYLERQRSIIHDGYKLILYPTGKILRLYHLDTDPQEARDLAGDPASAQKISDLFHRLLAMQRELNDSLDLKATYPDL